ncbi:MAG: hypothetical protein Q9160_007730 [Pyrenula sp. 1 TL-2023]
MPTQLTSLPFPTEAKLPPFLSTVSSLPHTSGATISPWLSKGAFPPRPTGASLSSLPTGVTPLPVPTSIPISTIPIEVPLPPVGTGIPISTTSIQVPALLLPTGLPPPLLPPLADKAAATARPKPLRRRSTGSAWLLPPKTGFASSTVLITNHALPITVPLSEVTSLPYHPPIFPSSAPTGTHNSTISTPGTLTTIPSKYRLTPISAGTAAAAPNTLNHTLSLSLSRTHTPTPTTATPSSHPTTLSAPAKHACPAYLRPSGISTVLPNLDGECMPIVARDPVLAARETGAAATKTAERPGVRDTAVAWA